MTVARATPHCAYRMKRGWWCSRGLGHNGPCALRPRRWNLSRFARLSRRFERGL